jgi:hypothetical protein
MDLPSRVTLWSPERNKAGYDRYVKSTYGDVFGASLEETMVTNPTPALARLLTPDLGEKLSPEEAQKRYGIGNLQFDEPISDERAQDLHDMQRAQMLREEIYATGPTGFRSTAAKFGAGLIGSVADPLNLATAFIPTVGLTKAASVAVKAGSIAAPGVAKTAGMAALAGAGEALLLEPIVYLGAKKAQLNYTMADSMANVAFGGILGGGAAGVARALQIKGELKAAGIKEELERVESEFVAEQARLELEERRDLFKTAFAEVTQDQMPRNVDAVLQRIKIDRAVTYGLSELTFKANGALSGDNVARLRSRSGGEAVAAIPTANVFDNRKQADSFIRATGDRSGYVVQRNENTGKYEVAKIKKATVVKNEIGQIKRYDTLEQAKKDADYMGDAKVVPLVKEKGRAEQTFIVIRGIDDEDVKVISKNPSMVEFYDPIVQKKASTPERREAFIKENGITLQEPRFDPNDIKNNIMIDEADHAELDSYEFKDLNDEQYNAETDELIEKLRLQKDFLKKSDMDELDAADMDIEDAMNEAIAMKAFAFCKRGA